MSIRHLFFIVSFGSCLYCISDVDAQQLMVEQGMVTTEESGEVKCWTTHVDQELAYVMGTYSAFVKELFNAKADKRGKTMLVAEKTIFPEISKLRLDQRAIFSTEPSGTAISFTFSPGYDIHFGNGTYDVEFRKAEAFVKSYVRYHYKTFYDEKVKAIQDKIKGKQNDIESNAKKTDRNNKTIAANQLEGETDKTKARNEKLQREIEGYASDTEAKRSEISALEEELAKLTESQKKTEGFK